MTSTMSSGTEHDNPYGVQLYPVESPSGSTMMLQTPEEADWYEKRRDLYTTHNKFPNISDLQDLDRLLTLEILVYRWSTWMAQGFDYLYARVDESGLKNNIREYSVEIRQLKAALGIDKVSRDKEKGESLPDYITTLLERAKTFGYHRNRQYEVAVTKFAELRTMVETYDRCDAREREELDLSLESIFQWIRENVIAEYDEIDEQFRKEQAMWIRSL